MGSPTIPRTCLVCGKTFKTHPSIIKRGGGLYCSRRCYQTRNGGTLTERLWSRVVRADGCWVWMGGRDEDGYGSLTYGKESYRTHRVAYEAAYGSIPDELCVLHRCDNPPCCRPDHLFLGTNADNSKDRADKGRTRGNFQPGEAHPTSKLDAKSVKEIRRLASDGLNNAAIARRFMLNTSTVWRIVNRQAWRHVE